MRILSFPLCCALKLLLGAALLSPQFSFAEEGVFKCVGVESTDKRLLNERAESVQGSYRETKSFTGEFHQNSYLASLEVNEESSGKVYFQSPGKMRWEYESPEEQLFILNKDTVWYYQPAQKQAMISKVNSILLTDLPIAFLMGLGDLQKSFSMLKTCGTSGGQKDILVLEPKEHSELKEVWLLVDKADGFVSGAKIVEASGNSTALSFTKIQKNSLEDKNNLFTFKAPAGVDVDDKRDRE